MEFLYWRKWEYNNYICRIPFTTMELLQDCENGLLTQNGLHKLQRCMKWIELAKSSLKEHVGVSLTLAWGNEEHILLLFKAARQAERSQTSLLGFHTSMGRTQQKETQDTSSHEKLLTMLFCGQISHTRTCFLSKKLWFIHIHLKWSAHCTGACFKLFT